MIILQQALKYYTVVFDAVFVPRETRLLREAAACGATVIDGLEMLIRLIMVQFKLFTGGMTGNFSFHLSLSRKMILVHFIKVSQ